MFKLYWLNMMKRVINYNELEVIRKSKYLSSDANVVVIDNNVYIISINTIDVTMLMDECKLTMNSDVVIKPKRITDIDIELKEWVKHNLSYNINQYNYYQLNWLKTKEVAVSMVMLSEDELKSVLNYKAKQLLEGESNYIVNDKKIK